MSFLGTLRAAFGYGASLDNPEQGYQTAGQLTGGRNDTDTTLTDERALSLSAVWACTRLIVQTGSSMPVKAYRETPLGRDLVAYDDPTATVLRQPNPLMTGAQFRAAIWTQRVLWGNGFAEIRRDSRGVVRSLWPLRPAHMSVERRGADLVYSYSTEEGVRELRKDQVFHVRGFSPDGIIGLSPLSYMRWQ
jgi:HK97 family phage portal protein